MSISVIDQSPNIVYAYLGNDVTLFVNTEGNDITYQWQYTIIPEDDDSKHILSSVVSKWTNIDGATNNAYTIEGRYASYYRFRCIIRDAQSIIYSNVYQVIYANALIAKNVSDVFLSENVNSITFYCDVEYSTFGDAPSAKWYYVNTSDNLYKSTQSTWREVPGSYIFDSVGNVHRYSCTVENTEENQSHKYFCQLIFNYENFGQHIVLSTAGQIRNTLSIDCFQNRNLRKTLEPYFKVGNISQLQYLNLTIGNNDTDTLYELGYLNNITLLRLTVINAINNQVNNEICIPSMTKLEEVEITVDTVTAKPIIININQNYHLKKIHIILRSIEQLYIPWLIMENSTAKSIESITITSDNNYLCSDSYDITSYNNLLELSLNDTPSLKYLNLYSNSKLKKLICSKNKLSYLNLFSNFALEALDIRDTAITELNVSSNPLLYDLLINGQPEFIDSSISDRKNIKYTKSNDANSFLIINQDTTLSTQWTITKHPQDVIAIPSKLADFDVTINNLINTEQTYSYSWETQAYGSDLWTSVDNRVAITKANKLTIIVTQSDDYRKYRCLITDNNGISIYSNPAVLRLAKAPTIVRNLSDQIIAYETEYATLDIEASGINLQFQWQVKENNSWSNIPNATASFLSLYIYYGIPLVYRCVITETSFENLGESNISIYSNECALDIQEFCAPIIATQPYSKNVFENTNVFFDLEIQENALPTTFEWQSNKDKNGNIYTKWQTIQSSYDPRLEFIATPSLSGAFYRCKVFNRAGAVYSNIISLITTKDIYSIDIQYQPENVYTIVNQTISFKVIAKGENLEYQWQYAIPDSLNSETNEYEWHNIANSNNSILRIVARNEYNGYLYRCCISNPYGTIYSNNAHFSIFESNSEGDNLDFQMSDSENFEVSTGGSEVSPYDPIIYDDDSPSSDSDSSSRLNLQCYGYHSIFISGQNTYGKWAMYPTSRLYIEPPEVKTEYIEIPGLDGGLDYTESLSGKIIFGYRKGSWEFMLIPGADWPTVYNDLIAYLHGRQHTVILEDDLTRSYTGRLSVNTWRSSKSNSTIVINYILDPFETKIQVQQSDNSKTLLEYAAQYLRLPNNQDKMIILRDNYAIAILQYQNGNYIKY